MKSGWRGSVSQWLTDWATPARLHPWAIFICLYSHSQSQLCLWVWFLHTGIVYVCPQRYTRFVDLPRWRKNFPVRINFKDYTGKSTTSRLYFTSRLSRYCTNSSPRRLYCCAPKPRNGKVHRVILPLKYPKLNVIDGTDRKMRVFARWLRPARGQTFAMSLDTNANYTRKKDFNLHLRCRFRMFLSIKDVFLHSLRLGWLHTESTGRSNKWQPFATPEKFLHPKFGYNHCQLDRLLTALIIRLGWYHGTEKMDQLVRWLLLITGGRGGNRGYCETRWRYLLPDTPVPPGSET